MTPTNIIDTIVSSAIATDYDTLEVFIGAGESSTIPDPGQLFARGGALSRVTLQKRSDDVFLKDVVLC